MLQLDYFTTANEHWRSIINGHLIFKGYPYTHPAFADYDGQLLQIKPDTYDPCLLHIIDPTNNNLICDLRVDPNKTVPEDLNYPKVSPKIYKINCRLNAETLTAIAQQTHSTRNVTCRYHRRRVDYDKPRGWYLHHRNEGQYQYTDGKDPAIDAFILQFPVYMGSNKKIALDYLLDINDSLEAANHG